jgi:REP element-mobilizing transposase RayT
MRHGGTGSDPQLASAPPDMAPAKLVPYLKGRRSRSSEANFGNWQALLGAALVGAVDQETIKKYIENQKWDEQDQGFKITAPTEP